MGSTPRMTESVPDNVGGYGPEDHYDWLRFVTVDLEEFPNPTVH